MKRLLFVLIAFTVIFTGCTMRYVLKDSIRPDVVLENKSDERVLVLIDDTIKNYTESIHASSLEGSIHTYVVSLGSAFYDGLVSSVKSKYLNVTVYDGITKGSFDKTIKFTLTEHKLKFVYATELFSTKAIVDFKAEIEMTITDDKNKIIKTKRIEGNSDFEGDANETTVDKYLGQTAKEGIKQIVNRTVSELIQ